MTKSGATCKIDSMKVFRFFCILILAFSLFTSCKSTSNNAASPEGKSASSTRGSSNSSSSNGNSDNFTVTDEVFNEAFVNIDALISELNKIIQAKNYSAWLTHLTREYITTYSDPDVLYELSQQPTLKRYNVRLRSLLDYFDYVVVPSRSETRLDDLIFLDENHVQAIMLIGGRRSILYSLEKSGNSWKIGI